MIMVWEWVRVDLIPLAEGANNLRSTSKEAFPVAEGGFPVDFISKVRKVWNCVGWLYTHLGDFFEIAIFD